jgi:hypothetical protein
MLDESDAAPISSLRGGSRAGGRGCDQRAKKEVRADVKEIARAIDKAWAPKSLNKKRKERE